MAAWLSITHDRAIAAYVRNTASASAAIRKLMDLGAHPFVSEPWTGVSRLLQEGPSIPELSETTMPVNFKLFDEI